MNYVVNKNKWLDSKLVLDSEKEEIKKLDDFSSKEYFSTLNLTSSISRKYYLGSNNFNRFTLNKISLAIFKYLKELEINEVLIGYSYDKHSISVKDELIKYLKRKLQVFSFSSSYPSSVLSYSLRHEMQHFGIYIDYKDELINISFYDKYGKKYLDEDIIELTLSYSSLPFELDLKEEINEVKEVIYLDNNDDYIQEYLFKESSISIFNNFLKGDKRVNIILVSDDLNQLNLIKKSLSYNNYTCLTYLNSQFNLNSTVVTLKQRKVNFLIIYINNSSCIEKISYLNNFGLIISKTSVEFSSLLLDFYLTALIRRNLLPSNPIVILSNKINKQFINILDSYGIEYFITSDDFKYITNLIQNKKDEGRNTIFSLTSDFSYLFANFVMDEDLFQALIYTLDLVECKIREGKTLDIEFANLDRKYGKYKYYIHEIKSPLDSALLMDLLRSVDSSFKSIKVNGIIDYSTLEVKNLTTHYVSLLDDLDIKKSNSLNYLLDDGYLLFYINKDNNVEVVINYKENKNDDINKVDNIILEIESILKLS